MRRFSPTKWLRERPIDFALALVILVVCLTVAIYQYRAQDVSGVSAGQATPSAQMANVSVPRQKLPG